MSHDDPIAIVLELQDDRGDFAAATVVRSAIDQLAADDAMIVYLLVDRVSEGTLERLARSWVDPRVNLRVIPLGTRLRAFDYHARRGAIARLMLGEVLPPEQKRVLHLDFDMLVLADLRPLWETDLQGQVLGCVADPFPEVRSVRRWLVEAARSIGWELGKDHIYFNAGVLLIDLERWRQEKVGETSISLLVAHPGLFPLIDQDALNLVLQNRVLYLPPIWNAMDPVSFLWQWDFSVYRGLAPEQALTAPAIRHFAGDFKPWQTLVRRSEVERFYQIMDRTDWCGSRPGSANLLTTLLQRWIDFHWLTVRLFWWPRSGALWHPWARQAANPLWWLIYVFYFGRLAALFAFYWPLRRWRDRWREKKRRSRE